jgi:hypothetical protein
MYFSLRYNNIPPIINVNNTVLHYVISFKLLGCFISNDLKWNVHIEYVLSKISKGVGLLTCAKHYFPVYVKRMIYFAFINSHLSYCVSIWGNAAQYLLTKLVVIQKKSIRMICNAPYLAHTNPLAYDLNILLLPELYKYRCAINMYCAVHNLNVLSTFDCFKRINTVHNTLRSDYLLIHPHVRTVLRQKSVTINSISIWNMLTPNVALSPSLAKFKSTMFVLLLSNYTAE